MIVDRLPSELKKFLSEVESLGFVLTLVGGIPRDLLFTDIIGHDFDFEIRASKSVDSKDWPAYYQSLLDHLSAKKYSFKTFPYLITRVEIGEYKLEFSSPRTEINKEDNFSHHHFDAVLDSNLSYGVSFKRRDFTINAIGIKLNLKNNSDELIDPYGGVHDLKNGILKNITDDFFHDSVRFLRLVRFQVKFNRFAIDSDLSDKLVRFNLTRLSAHHFKEELFKSFPGKFLNLFAKLVKEHNLKTPSEFSVWLNKTFRDDLSTREEILAYVFLQDKAEAEKVAQFFSLPAKVFKDLSSFYASYEAVAGLSGADLKVLSAKNVEEALTDPLFKELKNLEEKKIWCKHLHLAQESLPVSWKDWEGLTADPAELNALPAAKRSYLIYYKALKQKYRHD